MTRLLFLPFVLIYNFIMVNIGKSIVFALLAFVIYKVDTVKRYETIQSPIISHIKYGNEHLYITQSKEPSVLVFDKPQKVTNNFLHHQSETSIYNLFVVLTVIMVIIGIVAIIASIVEDEAAWDLMTVFHKTISTLIKCELEDGEFHYSILGRLVSIQSDRQYIGDYSLARKFQIDNLTTILNLPKYKTKTEKRNNFLSKLGV